MKKIYLLILIISTSLSSYSTNPPTIEWQRCIGGTGDDKGVSVIQTSDGGFIVGGYSNSTNGDLDSANSIGAYDLFIAKLDSTGNFLWKKSIGGQNDEILNSLSKTSDGGCIIAATTLSNNYGQVPPTHGGKDVYLVRLDGQGQFLFNTNYGGIAYGGSGDDEATYIEQTSDGGFIVAGSTISNNSINVPQNHGGKDIWVFKTDSAGTIISNKNFCLGGTGDEFPSEIHQTSDGGYILAGTSNSDDGSCLTNPAPTSSRRLGGDDGWILKLNGNLSIEWNKQVGDNLNDELYSITESAGGGYAFFGKLSFGVYVFPDTLSFAAPRLYRLNALGQDINFINVVTYATKGKVIQTMDHGYALLYETSPSDFSLSKTDESLNTVWAFSKGGSNTELPSSIQETSDGGFIVTGTTMSTDGDVLDLHLDFSNNPTNDYWVFKLSGTVGINEVASPIAQLSISPNPLTQSSEINFSLNSNETISMDLFDITGRKIKTIFAGEMSVGEHKLALNLTEQNIESGTYFLTISGKGFSKTQKIVNSR